MLRGLTDDELAAVMAAAVPLKPQDRDALLRDVAAELEKYSELGPGLIGRIVREQQRRHFDPPQLTGQRGRGLL